MLVALSSQIAFEESSTRVEVKEQRESIIEVLKERLPKWEEYEENWRDLNREALLKKKMWQN